MSLHLKSDQELFFELPQLWCLFEKSSHDCMYSYESWQIRKKNSAETLSMMIDFPEDNVSRN